MTGLVGFLCVTLSVSRASAFDYPEHEYISREALRALVSDPPEGTTSAEVQDDLRSLALAFPTSSFCAVDEHVLDPPAAKRTCFVPSDLPAMSGDHAGSPALLKWRFFEKAVESRAPHAAREAWDALSGLYKLRQKCAPPENALSVAPLPPAELLAAVRPHTLPTPERNEVPSDLQLSGADYSYLTLASNGCSHFRDPSEQISLGTSTLTSVRHDLAMLRMNYQLSNDPKQTARSKPDLNAFAWYADLHAGAIAFAHAASGLDGIDRQRLTSVALVFELFALHFLEDSVAAGHTLTTAKTMDNLAKVHAHDNANAEGLDERIPAEGCAALVVNEHPAAPELRKACETNEHLTIFGDHVMFRLPRFGEVGRVVASSAAALSLARVMGALKKAPAPAEVALRSCLKDADMTTAKDVAWTWPAASTEPWFYRCAFEWWEATGDGLASKKNLMEAAWSNGDMAALLILPQPSHGEVKHAGILKPGSSGCGSCGLAGAPAPNGAATLSALATLGAIVLRSRRRVQGQVGGRRPGRCE